MGAAILGNSTARPGQTRIRSQGGRPVVEEIYHFIVKADFDNEPFTNIRNATGLPRVGQTEGILTVVGVDCTRRPNSVKYWDVQVTFSTEVAEGQDSFNPEQQDPVTWVPVRETKLERKVDAIIKTRDNPPEAIVNSAGQGYETGLLIPRYIPVWEFYQFENIDVTDEDIADRCETTNDRVFKGRSKDTLLLNVESSVVGFYYGQRRRLTFYSIKYDKENWLHKRLNAGTWYLDGEPPNQTRKPFKDDDGEFNHLGLLDDDGGKLAIDAEPTFSAFQIYDRLDFSSFLRI